MPPSTRFPYRPVAAALAVACYAASATANPQGGVVKAGSATITANGSRLDVVQSSQRAVIDWRSFSIGAGGHVNFRQPSAAGATLNRVTGPEMSAILGRLTANGTVFLVNPNGILIGPGAKIDVGGLVAATANLSNENFMAGRYKFDEVVNRNAVIVNRGEITAHAGGLVALVAPGVENSGVIRAELGRVVLASGNRFTLDLFGDKLVTFAVDDKVAARLTDADGRPLQAYVNQTGKIEADGGSILIAASAAKAVLDNVINTSGVVRATSFAQRPGEIVLHGGDEGAVRVAGTLDASGRANGASGGSVKVLGADVVLGAGSRIDVAGDAGGGTAFVGGGVQGGGGLPRSSRTAIEAGATVNADALTRGNGGTIVAWSDGETRFAGAFSARGGAAGGDGGFVEVSGKRELAFAGAVDAGAPAGKGGRLLLDPDLLVVDAATATSIAQALRSGVSEVRTAADMIDVRQPIDGRFGAVGGGLTFEAGNAITVNNDIVTNDGPVVLRAGAGGIAMNAGPATSVTGGNGTMIHAGAASITLHATGDVIAEHLVTSGAVNVSSTLGSVTLGRDLAGPAGGGLGSLVVSAAHSARLKGVNATAPPRHDRDRGEGRDDEPWRRDHARWADRRDRPRDHRQGGSSGRYDHPPPQRHPHAEGRYRAERYDARQSPAGAKRGRFPVRCPRCSPSPTTLTTRTRSCRCRSRPRAAGMCVSGVTCCGTTRRHRSTASSTFTTARALIRSSIRSAMRRSPSCGATNRPDPPVTTVSTWA